MLDCVGEYGALAYVPIDVYLNAVRVAHDLAGGRREHGEDHRERLPRGRVRRGYGFVPDIHAVWSRDG